MINEGNERTGRLEIHNFALLLTLYPLMCVSWCIDGQNDRLCVSVSVSLKVDRNLSN